MGIQIVQRNCNKAISFFFGSLVGVTVDLVVFKLSIYLGGEPFYSNIISSGLAITVTFFFVTRYTFQNKTNIKRFSLFLAYYVFSITLFSIAIGFGVRLSGWSPMLCKLLSLPLSFGVNFLFSNNILGRK